MKLQSFVLSYHSSSSTSFCHGHVEWERARCYRSAIAFQTREGSRGLHAFRRFEAPVLCRAGRLQALHRVGLATAAAAFSLASVWRHRVSSRRLCQLGSAAEDAETLVAFRGVLKQHSLQAYIVPTDDPHMSEVPPNCFARRKFLTGFTGSAGSAVVTGSEALLWTDGRYFQQASLELSSSWKLMKSGLPSTPSLGDWLANNLQKGDVVGIDPNVHPATWATELQTRLEKVGVELRALTPNLVDEIWVQRPAFPAAAVRVHPFEFAGATVADKLTKVRDELSKKQVDLLAVTSLDEVSYLFNIRGGDVHRTPVVLAYGMVELNRASVFLDRGKLTPEVLSHLQDAEVEVRVYEDFANTLQRKVRDGCKVWMDIQRSNYSLFLAMGAAGPKETQASPVASMKVCKNESELAGMVAAHRRDGAAMCVALSELEFLMQSQQPVTEMDVDDIVTAARAKQHGYLDNSFDTIAGFGANGAIVHYVAQASNAATLGTDSFLLLDSGAQYVDGTTDVTRTVHFGTPTAEERELFTRVLKAHIGLATAVLPSDVPCFVLDAFARQPLWAVGHDYRHGTGHGVGAALAVHEMPPYVGQKWDKQDALQAGMIVSNEPGLYLEGRFGIRIENLMLVVEKASLGKSRSFLGLIPITLIPIQRSLIDISLLSDFELEYLNAYHARVRNEIGPMLAGGEHEKALTWLHRQTDPFVRTEEFRCLEQARQAAGLDGFDVPGGADTIEKSLAARRCESNECASLILFDLDVNKTCSDAGLASATGSSGRPLQVPRFTNMSLAESGLLHPKF
eukprot:s1402_g2.t1